MACVLKEDKSNSSLFGYPCDLCNRVICQSCNKTQAQEVRVIPSQTRTLVHLCPECLEDFKNIPKLVKSFKAEVTELKAKIVSLETKYHDTKQTDLGKQVTQMEENISEMRKQVQIANKTSHASTTAIEVQDITTVIKTYLDKQSEQMTNKLESVVGAIKSANKDLVSFLTTSDKFPHKKQQTAKNVPPELSLYKNVVVKGPTNSVQPAEDQITNSTESAIKSDGRICSGPERPMLKVANKNIGERIVKLSWIYLSNLDVQTKPDDILAVLDPKLAHIYQCHKLPSRFQNPNSAAFKLGIPEDLEEKYLSTDFWPDGCVVDRYRNRRQDNNGRSGVLNGNRRNFPHFIQRRHRK